MRMRYVKRYVIKYVNDDINDYACDYVKPNVKIRILIIRYFITFFIMVRFREHFNTKMKKYINLWWKNLLGFYFISVCVGKIDSISWKKNTWKSIHPALKLYWVMQGTLRYPAWWLLITKRWSVSKNISTRTKTFFTNWNVATVTHTSSSLIFNFCLATRAGGN